MSRSTADITIRQQTVYCPTHQCDVDLFTLDNGIMSVTVTTAGASIFRIQTPDQAGTLKDIACAPGDLDEFVGNKAYMGATVGRFANRIKGARFSLDDREYPLLANQDGEHQLHGGDGWHQYRWQARTEDTEADGPQVVFSRRSADGEGGFPGNVEAEVRYRLSADNALHVDFRASTDAPTVVNMTNHTYFNLNGADYQSLDQHWIQIPARYFTEVTMPDAIPTGRILPVEHTPLNLNTATDLNALLTDLPEALQVSNGIDHNYVFKSRNDDDWVTMAMVENTANGRTLTLTSTQPGLQFYTGNFMAGQPGPEAGRTYQSHQAFCLEPQHFPDTPNQPEFPRCVVRPGQPYEQSLIYTFGVSDRE